MSEPQANDHFSEKAQPKTLCYLIFKAEQLPLDRYQQMLNSKWVSEAEYKRLQTENEKLQEKVDFTEYQYDDLAYWFDKMPKDFKALEDENKKLQEIIDKQSAKAYELTTALSNAEGRLSAIKQHYEKRPDFCLYLPDGSRNWYQIGVLCRTWLEELGVLLNGKVEAKNK